MIHWILAHAKLEAVAIGGAVGLIALMGNNVTAPKVLAVMVAAGEWDNATTGRLILSTIISIVLTFITLGWCKRKLSRQAVDLTEKIEAEKKEKYRIAGGHVELLEKMKRLRRDLTLAEEKLSEFERGGQRK